MKQPALTNSCSERGRGELWPRALSVAALIHQQLRSVCLAGDAAGIAPGASCMLPLCSSLRQGLPPRASESRELQSPNCAWWRAGSLRERGPENRPWEMERNRSHVSLGFRPASLMSPSGNIREVFLARELGLLNFGFSAGTHTHTQTFLAAAI